MARKSDIRLRRSNVANAVPGSADLNEGELAINTADGALYFKKSDGTIITGHDNTIMHIDSAGSRVGIGNVNPGKELDVLGTVRAKDSSANQHQLRADKIISYGTDAILQAQSSGDDVRLNTTGNVTRLIATAEGNVGIGTNSPAAKLQVDGAIVSEGGSFASGQETKTDAGLVIQKNDYIYSDDNSYLRKIIGHASNNNIEIGQQSTVYVGDILLYPGSSGNVRFFSSGSEDVRIDSSGNMGIGTTSPQTKLDIQNGSAGTAASVVAAGTSAGIYLEDDQTPTDNYFVSKVHNPGNATAIGGIKFAVSPDASNYSWAGIKGLTSTAGNAGNLAFYTSASNTSGDSSTERMRIDSSGNLLVGTTSVSNSGKITVDGGTNGNGIYAVTDASAGYAGAVIERSASDGDLIIFKKSTAKVGSIGVINTNNLTIGSSASNHSGLQFGTAVITPMRAGSESDAQIDIGFSNARFKDLYLSGAIYSGAITSAKDDNTLTVQSTNAGQASVDIKNTEGHFRLITDAGTLKVYDETDSSERFRIDSSGNVGINETDPNGKLVVRGANYAANQNGGIIIQAGPRNSSHWQSGFKIKSDSSGNARTAIEATTGATDGTSTEAITINTAANVGIGVTSLVNGDKLTVNGNINLNGKLFNGTSNNSAGLDFASNYVNYHGYAGHRFYAQAAGIGSMAERMRITVDGNVGIGITNPSDYWGQADNLVVGGTGNDGITIKSAAAGNGRLVFTDTASSTAGLNDGGQIQYNHGSDFMALRTNGAEAMRIDSSGNTIFGGTSVGAAGAMSVKVDGSYTDLYLYGAGTSQGGRIFFGDSSDRSSIIGTYGSGGGGKLSFKTDTTGGTSQDRLVIDSDGSITFNGAFTFPTSIGAAGQILKVPATGTTLIWGADAGGGSATLLTDSDGDTLIQVEESTDEDKIRFDTAGTQRMVITDTGRIGVNVESPAAMLHVNGGIIAVGDGTNTSYYEEDKIHSYATSGFIIDGREGITLETSSDDKDITFKINDSVDGLQTYMTVDGGEGRVVFNKWTRHVDNARILVGTGGDLAIYHTGTNSYIDDQGTGALNIRSSALFLEKQDGSEVMASFIADGAVSLYHNNSKKFETTSGGVNVVGNITTTGYLRGPASFVIDPAAHGDDTGTVVIAGNLQVDGTTTTINSTTLTVDDKNITLASGSANAAAANGAGLTVDGANATLTYTNSDDQWELNKSLRVASGNLLGGHTLLVENTGTAQAIIKFKPNSTRNAGPFIKSTPRGASAADGDIQIGDENGTIATFNYGRVGIGITSPVSNLHVKTSVDNSVAQGLVIERSANTDRGYINYNGGGFQFRSTVGDPIVFGETDAEHMRILPDGNVGIGTTTPDEFGLGGSFRILSVGGDNPGILNLVDDGTNGSYLQFGNAAGLRRASIHAENGSDLAFTLNSSNTGTSLTERLRIKASTGNVGIGTASPSHKLDVNGTIRAQGAITSTLTSSGGTFLSIGHSGNENWSFDAKSGSGSTDYVDFGIAGGTRCMTWQEDGNVGIGTAAPSYKLHVKETGTNAGAIYVEDGTSWLRVVPNLGGSGFSPLSVAGDIGLIFSNDNDNSTNSSTNGLLIAPHSSNAQGIKILEDGRVGIATTTPNSRFTVNVGSQGDGIELQSSEVSIAKLSRTTYSSTVVASLDGVTGRPIHIGGIINEDVLLANAGGDVGIGTASPVRKLHVYEPGGTNVVARFESSDSQVWIDLQDSNSSSYNGSSYGCLIGHDPAADVLFMVADGTVDKKLLIDNAGNVGIGTTDPTNHINTGSFFKPDSNGKFLTVNGGANGSFIMLESQTTTDNDQIGGIYWNRTGAQGDAHKQVAGIDVIQDAYAPNNLLEGGTLRFFTKVSGSGVNTPRMVITGGGNVGIGITNPSNLLHIHATGNGSSALIIEDDARRLEMGRDIIQAKSSNGSTVQNLYIQPAGITSFASNSGAVAIGSTGTLNSAKLYVKNGSSGQTYSNMSGILIDVNGTSNSYYGLRVGSSSGNNHLVVTNAGNVGIGTASVDAKLKVNQDAIATSLKVMGGNSGSNIAEFVRDVGGTGTVSISGYSSNPQMHFASTGNTFAVGVRSNSFNIADHSYIDGTNIRLAIDNTGRVGIGTNSPNTKLHVYDNVNRTSIKVQNSSHSSSFEAYGNATAITTDASNGLFLRISDVNKVHLDNNGNFGVNVTDPKAKFQVEEYGIDTTTSSTAATTQVAIHTFPIANFRSARFTVQITNTTDSTYHSTEILAIHDGTTANITEFGEVHTGSSVEATFDADVSSGNFRLLATPASTDAMAFKVVCHSLTV